MKNKGLMFVGIGFELVGLVISAVVLGQMIDDAMGWPGYGIVIALILALCLWFYHLVFLMKRYLELSKQEEISRFK